MRRAPLEAKPAPDRSGEPGYREWKTPSFGRCAVCGKAGLLERHHVVLEQHVRAAGGDPYNLANGLLLGMHCRCHRQHHAAAIRISLAHVPDAAVAFASQLLGAGAGEYLSKYYAP